MNEQAKNATNANEAWSRLRAAVNEATALYAKELSAYLTWTRDVQREVLEQNFELGRQANRIAVDQLAFYQRLRASFPPFGTVPKGTETIVGMVDAVLRETGRHSE
jgi:hypothetical protein